MKVEALSNERLNEFIAYCKEHRSEIDDSFLYEEDLKEFKPDEENPTYIVLNDGNEIVAAASMIIDDYNRRGRKSRFRIFHSKADHTEYYDMLLKALLKHTAGMLRRYHFAV